MQQHRHSSRVGRKFGDREGHQDCPAGKAGSFFFPSSPTSCSALRRATGKSIEADEPLNFQDESVRAANEKPFPPERSPPFSSFFPPSRIIFGVSLLRATRGMEFSRTTKPDNNATPVRERMLRVKAPLEKVNDLCVPVHRE
ncbi:hypothetical protein KM043_006618 [Ampulex compressa]|nr:hypothetical protein KM043_006618 [Ampulex compressa]